MKTRTTIVLLMSFAILGCDATEPVNCVGTDEYRTVDLGPQACFNTGDIMLTNCGNIYPFTFEPTPNVVAVRRKYICTSEVWKTETSTQEN
jgi:hypothetical protein